MVEVLSIDGEQSTVPAHHATTTKKWLNDCRMKRFVSCAGNSLDLNPIENLRLQIKHLPFAKTGTCNLDDQSQESCPQGFETNHSVVPGKVLQINTKIYGNCS